MIDKLKVFEKPFQEFVEWMKSEHNYFHRLHNDSRFCNVDDYIITFVPDRELRSLLIEFLDSKGIYLTSGRYYNSWMWSIHKEKDYQFWETAYEEDYNSRTEATEAGIIRAFEIYNQKEK